MRILGCSKTSVFGTTSFVHENWLKRVVKAKFVKVLFKQNR